VAEQALAPGPVGAVDVDGGIEAEAADALPGEHVVDRVLLEEAAALEEAEHAALEPVTCRLPAEVPERRGEVLVDTAELALAEGERECEKGGEYEVRHRGMVVMREAL
jgi:hypothetical protein